MKLKEGIDYTLEKGLLVFTREYLLRRGTCCESGCRNCPYGFTKKEAPVNTIRIVSLVPSWTETLIDAGLNVVGRTRFCVHPEPIVKNIPAVGGTKKIDAAALRDLKPDLVVLDKEENSAEVAEAAGGKALVTHVTSMDDVPESLLQMAEHTESERLRDVAKRWRAVITNKPEKREIAQLPGVIEWLSLPTEAPKNLLYIIWRDPWMAASKDTFIGSILKHLGFEAIMLNSNERYPKIDLRSFQPNETVLLFSSEPYPFPRYIDEIKSLGFPSALINGELYGWFGIRALRFLEEL